MYTSFYIAENRINELKSFIRVELPTARFKHNPLKEGCRYFIALNMSIEDSNKLNELHNKWYEEDNTLVKPNKSFLKQILSFFN